jgi:predicted component of type VI protein secretion system
MRVEAVRSEEPELAWSVDDEGLKFRSDTRAGSPSREVASLKAERKKNDKDDDEGSGPGGVSITARILPFFSFSGSPALA